MKEKKISAKLEKLAVENNYIYMRSKAKMYLKLGPEKYRKGDAFGMPPEEWEKEYGKGIWEILDNGCRQFLEYKGLTAAQPLTGIGIAGFYRLVNLFHFKPIGQKAKRIPDKGFLDEMNLEHIVTKDRSTLFNLI